MTLTKCPRCEKYTTLETRQAIDRPSTDPKTYHPIQVCEFCGWKLHLEGANQ